MHARTHARIDGWTEHTHTHAHAGATKLAEVLTDDNRTLQHLWLADCGLSHEGGAVMSEVGGQG